MAKAYVLINVGTGVEDTVLRDVKKIQGVKEVYVSYGAYDLIVFVDADSSDEMKEIVTHHLRTIDNVKSTLTLTVID